jgi:Contractile injection system tube protein
MTTFPGSPRLQKGAIVGIDASDPVPRVILFQYNPDTLTRTLEAQTVGGQGGDRSEALRLKGAPVENFKLEVEIDATDQLETAQGPAVSMGVYPQLSALEMLIYPNTSLVLANTALLALGTIEIIPPTAPFTLFVWGPKRALPVRLTEFSITEESHDTNLNPIRAKVSLGLRVLSYNDLPTSHPGYSLFLSHQVMKEAMAVVGTVNDLGAVAGVNVNLLR